MEIAIRATVVFWFLFLLTRGLKKRTLGDLAPFELLFLVTLGDIVQQGVTQEDYSLTGAILATSTFAGWVSLLTWLSWRSSRARRMLEGVPLVLVRDGEPVQAALDLEQLPMAELMEAVRQQGVADLQEVRLAILEPSGRISVIRSSGQGAGPPPGSATGGPAVL
jgi:uncharacterized membrane protein YcaP (DUF421 family)